MASTRKKINKLCDKFGIEIISLEYTNLWECGGGWEFRGMLESGEIIGLHGYDFADMEQELKEYS